MDWIPTVFVTEDETLRKPICYFYLPCWYVDTGLFHRSYRVNEMEGWKDKKPLTSRRSAAPTPGLAVPPQSPVGSYTVFKVTEISTKTGEVVGLIGRKRQPDTQAMRGVYDSPELVAFVCIRLPPDVAVTGSSGSGTGQGVAVCQYEAKWKLADGGERRFNFSYDAGTGVVQAEGSSFTVPLYQGLRVIYDKNWHSAAGVVNGDDAGLSVDERQAVLTLSMSPVK